jgi:RNA polymerase sigma factor (sigma-70 family)
MSVRPNRFPRIPPDLAELLAGGTDADLLRIIGDERERNREWAEAALMELHRRHAKFLYPVCLRICEVFLADPNQVENLLSRTFWSVFRTAERFLPEKTNCNGDAACLHHAVRCWMARKARWLAKDIAERSAGRASVALCGPDSLDQLGQEDDDLSECECSEEMTAALNRLTPRERHIVLATYFFLDCETGNPVPPTEHVDVYLARRWGTTPPNVRQIRSRALAKLREMLTPVSTRPADTR